MKVKVEKCILWEFQMIDKRALCRCRPIYEISIQFFTFIFFTFPASVPSFHLLNAMSFMHISNTKTNASCPYLSRLSEVTLSTLSPGYISIFNHCTIYNQLSPTIQRVFPSNVVYSFLSEFLTLHHDLSVSICRRWCYVFRVHVILKGTLDADHFLLVCVWIATYDFCTGL